jgi:hypothetical protein
MSIATLPGPSFFLQTDEFLPAPELAPTEVERWAWILLLLDSAERAGLTPIETPRFHTLAFFANCLAPVYDLPAASDKIIKFARGPFYPDFQWDLDRLVAMGFVELRSFEPFQDARGWWFTASYVASARALHSIEYLRESPRLARIHAFQRELASAFADLPDVVQGTSPERDATFADPTVPEGALIDFAAWADNHSGQAAEAVSQLVGPGLRLGPRDRIHLYFRYLGRVEPAGPPDGKGGGQSKARAAG